MNAQQLHHQPLPHELFCFVEPEDIEELHLSGQTTYDDSVWDEFESEYAEESFPNHVLAFIKETEWE